MCRTVGSAHQASAFEPRQISSKHVEFQLRPQETKAFVIETMSLRQSLFVVSSFRDCLPNAVAHPLELIEQSTMLRCVQLSTPWRYPRGHHFRIRTNVHTPQQREHNKIRNTSVKIRPIFDAARARAHTFTRKSEASA